MSQVVNIGPEPITFSPKSGSIPLIITLHGVPFGFNILCRHVLLGSSTPEAADLRGTFTDSVIALRAPSQTGQGYICPLPTVQQSSGIVAYDLYLSANSYNWLYASRINLVPAPLVRLVKPSSGPVAVAIQLTVFGTAFLATSNLTCVFGVPNGTTYINAFFTDAVYSNNSFLSCVTPKIGQIANMYPAFAVGGLIPFQVGVSLNGRDASLGTFNPSSQTKFYSFDEPVIYDIIPRDASVKDPGQTTAPTVLGYNISIFGTGLGFDGSQPLPQFWARLTFPQFCATRNSGASGQCWQRTATVFAGGLNRTRAYVLIAQAPQLTGTVRKAPLGLEFSVDGGSTISQAPQAINIYYVSTTPLLGAAQAGGGATPSCQSAVGDCGAGICSLPGASPSDACLCFHVQVYISLANFHFDIYFAIISH